jgi:hypothetical protein
VRLLRLIPVFLLVLVPIAASGKEDDPAARIRKLERAVRTETDATAWRTAVRRLRARDPERLQALLDEMEKKLRAELLEGNAKAERLGAAIRAGEKSARMKALLEAWQREAQAAWDLVFDPVRFPAKPPGAKSSEGCEEVMRRVHAVGRAWEDVEEILEPVAERLLTFPPKVAREHGERLGALQVRLDLVRSESRPTEAWDDAELALSPLTRFLHLAILGEPQLAAPLLARIEPGLPRFAAFYVYGHAIRDGNAAHPSGLRKEAVGGVDDMNEYRMRMGLNPLRHSAALVAAAEGHASEMTRLGYWSHFSPIPENHGPQDRARNAGYASTASEVLVKGIGVTAAALAAWQTSAGHHRCILGGWNETGASSTGHGVLMFGLGEPPVPPPLEVRTSLFEPIAEEPVEPTSARPPLDLPDAPPGDARPVAAAWRLALSDLAVYDRRKVKRHEGRLVLGKRNRWSVHGHDLRDGGRYLPVSARLADLPLVVALRLPAGGKGEERVRWRIAVRGVAELRFEGTLTSHELGEDRALVRGDLEFASVPKEDDAHRVLDGRARVCGVFDLREGVVRGVRVDLAYQRRDRADRQRTRVRFVDSIELSLREVRRTRYPGFRGDVERAIESGVAWLRTRQKEDGSFPPVGRYAAGTAGLCALTLAACGVPRDDPALAKTLDWISGQEARFTYEKATCLMAFDRAYASAFEIRREAQGKPVTRRRDLPPDHRAWCERTAASLLECAHGFGSWHYDRSNPQYLVKFDLSNTQYGVLGLRAASRLGIEIPERHWVGVIRQIKTVRERGAGRARLLLTPEGAAAGSRDRSVAPIRVPDVAGFRYTVAPDHARAWASMTCAGIASLEIARHELGENLGRRLSRDVDDMVHGAWVWLVRHWGVNRHPEHPSNHWILYYLYSLERAGILTRTRLVDGRDWYYEGAVEILLRQKKEGSWDDKEGKEVSTCFALLFLKRATAPLTK